MTLGDEQIERYSRQIIVPRVGGRAQQRLLSSRLVLAGALDTIAAPLAYLVGAGVGTIHLAAMEDGSRLTALIASMRDLNSDVTVSPVPFGYSVGNDLLFAVASTNLTVDAIRALASGTLTGPSVTVRLDDPARIAVLPSPPPCLRCAGGGLLSPMREQVESPGFLTMVACVEVLKLLCAYEPGQPASIIQFNGYASVARPLAAALGMRCVCGGAK